MNQRKLWSFVVCVLMVLVLMVGCSGKSDKSSEGSGNSTAIPEPVKETPVTSASTPGTADGAKPAEFKYMTFGMGTMTKLPDFEVIKQWEKLNNVKVKWEVIPQDGYDQKFKLTMASGDIPDVMTINEDPLKYVAQGAPFLNFKDYLDKMPNLKRVLESDTEAASLIQNNGDIWYLPELYNLKPGMGFFVREDWLKKLGMNHPKTIEEIHQMLVAFRDKKPNGQKSIIPYSDPYGLTSLYHLFGYDMGAQQKEDGTFFAAPFEPGFKNATAELRKWYGEKLIDPEQIKVTDQKWQEKISKSQVGMSNHWFALTDQMMALGKKDVPEFNLVAVIPPVIDNNQVKVPGRGRIAPNRTVVNKNSPNLDAILKFLDYTYSVEGNTLLQFGIEGTTYEMKDGKPVYKDVILKPGEGKTSFNIRNFEYGLDAWNLPGSQNLDAFLQLVGPNTADANRTYDAYVRKEHLPINKSSDILDLDKKVWPEVERITNEYLSKIIVGQFDMNKFDEMIDKIKQTGLSDLIDKYNTLVKK